MSREHFEATADGHDPKKSQLSVQQESPTQWVQPMSNARDCIHGSLASKCEICERDEEIFNLKSKLTEQRQQLDFWIKEGGKLVAVRKELAEAQKLAITNAVEKQRLKLRAEEAKADSKRLDWFDTFKPDLLALCFNDVPVRTAIDQAMSEYTRQDLEEVRLRQDAQRAEAKRQSSLTPAPCSAVEKVTLDDSGDDVMDWAEDTTPPTDDQLRAFKIVGQSPDEEQPNETKLSHGAKSDGSQNEKELK